MAYALVDINDVEYFNTLEEAQAEMREWASYAYDLYITLDEEKAGEFSTDREYLEYLKANETLEYSKFLFNGKIADCAIYAVEEIDKTLSIKEIMDRDDPVEVCNYLEYLLNHLN